MTDKQKQEAFEDKRDAWADAVLMEYINPVAKGVVTVLQSKMQKGPLSFPFRVLHGLFAYFYKLELKHIQHYEMHPKGQKGFRKHTTEIKSVTVEVLLNGKKLGEKNFPLGIMLQHG